MEESLELVVDANGGIRCIYGEALDLKKFGPLQIQRASHVEPTPDGLWTADMTASRGPVLGPFDCRRDALAAEREWLLQHHIGPP